jgi:hypothetical protein
LNPIPPEAAERRSLSPEKAKILQGCRDMAIERLEALFATMLDKLADMLMTRGDASESQEEDGQLSRDARTALARERANLLVEFEKALARARRRSNPRQEHQSRFFEARCRRADPCRSSIDGRVGDHRQHRSRHREQRA